MWPLPGEDQLNPAETTFSKLRRKKIIYDSKIRAILFSSTFSVVVENQTITALCTLGFHNSYFGKTSLTSARLKSNYQIISHFIQSEL